MAPGGLVAFLPSAACPSPSGKVGVMSDLPDDPPIAAPPTVDGLLNHLDRRDAMRRQVEARSDTGQRPDPPSTPASQAQWDAQHAAMQAVEAGSLRVLPFDAASRQAMEIADLGLEVLRKASQRVVRLDVVVPETGDTLRIGLHQFGNRVIRTCRYNGQNMLRDRRVRIGRGPTGAAAVEFIRQRSRIVAAIQAERARLIAGLAQTERTGIGGWRRRPGGRDSPSL
jgi:hypothetical protein